MLFIAMTAFASSILQSVGRFAFYYLCTGDFKCV
ncbi:MAG: hypothetical protein U1E98_05640 [Moraxella osloensis]